MTKRKGPLKTSASNNPKRRKAWRDKPKSKFAPDLPKFLDAESNVTAARFGARRLPEMRKMWHIAVQESSQGTVHVNGKQNPNVNDHDDEAYYRSGGCKVSNRHLRRRTGSHNRRRRHRFPNGFVNTENASDSVSGDVLFEKQDGPTKTSGDPMIDGNAKFDADSCAETKTEAHVRTKKSADTSGSRRARRKHRLLRVKHSQWKHETNLPLGQPQGDNDQNDHNDDGIESISSHKSIMKSQSHWLETHLWHTKRFYMSPPLSIYNQWCLPLGHTNRGSRAALRLAKSGSTVQDATWAIAGSCITLKIKDGGYGGDGDNDEDLGGDGDENLVHIVERLCGGNRMHSAPFLTNEEVLKGRTVGYGLMYDLERNFPLGAVGPASFLFGVNANVDEQHEKANKGVRFVRICVDGSILTKVQDIIQTVVNDFNQDSELQCIMSREPTALIRVRGDNATNVISKSLPLMNLGPYRHEHQQATEMDWNKLSAENSDLHTSLPHGTILKVKFDAEQKNTLQTDDMGDQGTHDLQIGKEQLIKIHKQNSTLNSTPLRGNDIFLISQAPNNTTSGGTKQNPNSAINGWDIYCPADLVSPIFHALNYDGGACAIGYIEDCSNRMEAEPPLPMFPRDFPDTMVGKKYWSGGHHEWNVLRYCIEEGLAGGRIKTGLKRLVHKCNEIRDNVKDSKITTIPKELNVNKISWELLESYPTSIDTSSPSGKDIEHSNNGSSGVDVDLVVVRGNFMAPFMQALKGFGEHYMSTIVITRKTTDETSKVKSCRPRRKIQGKSAAITLPPVNSDLLTDHHQFCASLSNSLSLPALLRCHLVVEGKGVLRSGMQISSRFESKKCNKGDDNSNGNMHIIGYVNAGGFSQSRGKFHGVGILSSKKFLSFLSEDDHLGFMAVEREAQKTIALRVAIHHDNSQSESPLIASLTLLE